MRYRDILTIGPTPRMGLPLLALAQGLTEAAFIFVARRGPGGRA